MRRLLLPLVILLSGCAAPAPAASDGRPIVAFGDSYTEGYGAKPNESYPALLERDLGVRVVNAGVSGETALEALPRLKRDVLDADPRLVIVEFGVNEAFRGYPVTVALDGLDKICANLSARGIPIVLVGVHFANYSENFDAGLRNLSDSHGTGLVLDVLHGVLDDPALRSDAYHPNAKGYAVMESRIAPVVREALARDKTS